MGNINIKTLEVSGWTGAFKGMRAPMESYAKSDSSFIDFCNIGDADMKLALNLIKGGTEHSKFRRMIQIQAEVSMPRYIWSEWDTYKISTVSNSESTMHKLLNNKNPITENQFYFGEEGTDLYKITRSDVLPIIEELECLRLQYMGDKPTIFTKNQLLILAKRMLPECFIQTRVWCANYETLANMYNQRVKHPHRLKEEWVDCFGEWVKSLPYANQLILGDE